MKNIIFDFGGVLVDWNPRYMYRKQFDTEEEMEFFLKNICNDEWNAEQDRGRPFAEAIALLQKQYPSYADKIALYWDKWEEMLKDEIHGTVQILHELKAHYTLYGLTNWSAETIDFAFQRFDFFKEFRGILVSGREKLIKPDPKIFQLLFQRFNISPSESLFIDDNEANIKTAKSLGLQGILFKTPTQLRQDLEAMKLLS